ncbi:MAG: molybdopterin cofactor-binding domain-containing protein [Polyangiaceae bacterium]
MRPDCPPINPRHSNLLSRSRIVRGDVDAALASSPHVVSGTWRTQRVEHLYLEPESCLAPAPRKRRQGVQYPGTGIFDDQRQIASFLGLPPDEVQVEPVPQRRSLLVARRTCPSRPTQPSSPT